ncbi:hypothetical protein K1719_008001 [Acacia pycnantha]|nr:hypothetical protein K1719_008001 [Acacia pycnantha]
MNPFVAISDADFEPNPDFLKLTISHVKPELGLAQARWPFVNKDENLPTRLQNLNLCFHFKVEQQVKVHFLNFFGFNGRGGVFGGLRLWKSQGGGWLEGTTLEDMVIAHLKGYLIALAERESKCSNEDNIFRRPSESGLEILSQLKEEEVPPRKKRNRIHRKELALAFMLLAASASSLMSQHGVHFYFLMFQRLSFLAVGLDLIGEQVS